MTKPSARYCLEIAPEAEGELGQLRTFDVRPIVETIELLRFDAETPTRNRKPLAASIPSLPEATWEARMGDFRVLYEVKNHRIVTVLRVIFKGRQTMDEAVSGSRRE